MDFLLPEVKIEFYDCEKQFKDEIVAEFKCGEITYSQNEDGHLQTRRFNLQCLHCSLTFTTLSEFTEHINEIYPLVNILKNEHNTDDAVPAAVNAATIVVGSKSSADSRAEEMSISDTKTTPELNYFGHLLDTKSKQVFNCKTKINLKKKDKLKKVPPVKKARKKDKTDESNDTKTENSKCYLCSFVCKSALTLRNHIENMHIERKHKCEICNKTFSAGHKLNHHLRTHDPAYNCVCDICGAECVSLGKMRDHMCKHSGQRPYECKYCKKTFIHHSSLFSHTNYTHLNKRFRHMCNYCGKVYKQPKRLTEHIRTHTGENPFKCDYCDKGFTRSCHKIQHERTHTGEKPFKCHFCDNRYATYAGVAQHERCLHKEMRIMSGRLKPIIIKTA